MTNDLFQIKNLSFLALCPVAVILLNLPSKAVLAQFAPHPSIEHATVLDWTETLPNLDDPIQYDTDQLLIFANRLDLRNRDLDFYVYKDSFRYVPRHVILIADELQIGGTSIDLEGSNAEANTDDRNGGSLSILARKLILDTSGPGSYPRYGLIADVVGGEYTPGWGGPARPGFLKIYYEEFAYIDARGRTGDQIGSAAAHLRRYVGARVDRYGMFSSPLQRLRIEALGNQRVGVFNSIGNVTEVTPINSEDVATETIAALTLWQNTLFQNAIERLEQAKAKSDGNLVSAVLREFADYPIVPQIGNLRQSNEVLARRLNAEYRFNEGVDIRAGQATALSLRSSVAKLEATFDDGSKGVGYGLVIGQRNEQTIVVTAGHVIQKIRPMADPVLASSVIASFFGDAEGHQAKVLHPLPSFYADGVPLIDLGVLAVDSELSVGSSIDVEAQDVAPLRGIEVWSIAGSYGDWTVPNLPGTFQDDCDRRSCQIATVEDLTTSVGDSGGAIVTERGVAGIIRSGGTEGPLERPVTRVITIAAVANALTEYWGIDVSAQ